MTLSHISINILVENSGLHADINQNSCNGFQPTLRPDLQDAHRIVPLS